MSRANRSQRPADGRQSRRADRFAARPADQTAGHPAGEPVDSAQVAEDIGMAALDLAKRARDAGLTAVGYLLESVALEAGAEAASRQWPPDR
jgi:hypothetical protein